MKAINRVVGTVAVGCVLALSTTPYLQAQDQKSPPGTYYSAKDFDLKPPLPFNPHPELEVVEIEPGIFLIDDTKIPDTPEQAAARAAHQAAVEHAKAIAANPALAEAERAARQAAQEALWKQNRESIAQFLVKPIGNAAGDSKTLAAIDAEQRSALLADSLNVIAVQQAAASNAESWAESQGISPRALLPDGGITSIVDINDGAPRFLRTQNAVSADTISTDEVRPGGSTGLSLTGTNTVIAIWDGGDVRLTHQEFNTNGARAFDLDATSPLGEQLHPTHVAGTLIAGGVSAAAIGMSPRARLSAYDWYSDIGEMGAAAATNNLHISNHSYASQVGWGTLVVGGTPYWAWFGNTNISQTEDYQFGFYNSSARNADSVVYGANYYLPVWAAANERGSAGQAPSGQPIGHYAWNGTNFVAVFTVSRPADGDTGGFDTLPPESVAKNILTVGSVADLVGGYSNAPGVSVSTFSSFGPTDDGRVKPDLMANGELLTSSSNAVNNGYTAMSGTSMATPSVAGSLNLLVERYGQLYGTNRSMLASTLKGLAIHTADEAGSFPGPDYRFGWGLMNTRTAALLIDSNYQSQVLANIKEVILNNGDYIEFPVVATNTRPLKVPICWTDPPGTSPGASVDPTNRMLINDLDLRVVRGSTTNFPWVLDPVTRTNAAATGDNIRDNVEQVVITNAASDTYLIRVAHKGTLVDTNGAAASQRISILVSGNIAQPKPPLVLASPLLVSSNQVALSWPSVVGLRYELQYKDDLNVTNWTNIGGEISATKTNVAVTTAFTNAIRFYRVAELQ